MPVLQHTCLWLWLAARAVGWDVWRPGGEPIELREEERVVQGEADRHTSCAFEVLDANAEDFEAQWAANLHRPMMIKNLQQGWSAAEAWGTVERYKDFVRAVQEAASEGSRLTIQTVNMASRKDVHGVASGGHRWSRSRLKDPSRYFDELTAKDNATGAHLEPNAFVFDVDFGCDEDEHLDHVAPMPKILRQYRCAARHFAAGALGTGHGTHRHEAAWQSQVVGFKSWYIFPPRVGADYMWLLRSDHPHGGFPHEEVPMLTNSMCGYRPTRKHYRDSLLRCVQGPGETVYVPKHWWHATCALDDFNLATGGTLVLEDPAPWVGDEVSRLPAKAGVHYGLGPISRERPSERGVLDFDHGTPEELLESVRRRLAPFGQPPGIDLLFEAIDGYCWDEQWQFNLGDVKGGIVEQVVAAWVRSRQPGPVNAIEFGSYLGYSALRQARYLPADSEFLCVEPSYAEPEFAAVVDQLLKWAVMEAVIRFLPTTNYPAIEMFASEGRVFDLVCTDHLKGDYLATLQAVIAAGLFQPGGLFLADNVIFFPELTELLKYLRTSRLFVDYKISYSEVEYADHLGPPASSADGVVFATFVGEGKGKLFESPDSATCVQFTDCAECLVSLCGWCAKSQRCVVDEEGADDGVCGDEGGPLLGTFAGDMRCWTTSLRPKEWVAGPPDDSGALQWGGGVQRQDALVVAGSATTEAASTIDDSPAADKVWIRLISKSPGDVVVYWQSQVDGLEEQRQELATVAADGTGWTSIHKGHVLVATCADKSQPEEQPYTVNSDSMQAFEISLPQCKGSQSTQPRVTFTNKSGGAVQIFFYNPEAGLEELDFDARIEVKGQVWMDAYVGNMLVALCADVAHEHARQEYMVGQDPRQFVDVVIDECGPPPEPKPEVKSEL